MPGSGPRSVTVPGALSGWTALLERYGTLELAEALQPAIDIAQCNKIMLCRLPNGIPTHTTHTDHRGVDFTVGIPPRLADGKSRKKISSSLPFRNSSAGS